MASTWPAKTVTEHTGKHPDRHYWTAETAMPCGRPLSVTTDGFNSERVRARAQNTLKANAIRHLRTCNNCEVR